VNAVRPARPDGRRLTHPRPPCPWPGRLSRQGRPRVLGRRPPCAAHLVEDQGRRSPAVPRRCRRPAASWMG